MGSLRIAVLSALTLIWAPCACTLDPQPALPGSGPTTQAPAIPVPDDDGRANEGPVLPDFMEPMPPTSEPGGAPIVLPVAPGAGAGGAGDPAAGAGGSNGNAAGTGDEGVVLCPCDAGMCPPAVADGGFSYCP